MANFSLYISGQTELNDVTEFFQKRLIGEGETPIAFFDGVFYESHQERVGNIVYQDYLIYSDKALYLWARGASKDFLDRFTLGAVSVNSRNKDSAFATMNLKIRREGKEPVFVIFDMVEIREAEMIVKLQTVVESVIEDYLGVNYRKEIPDDTADRILLAARNICPPSLISLPLEAPQMPVPDAGIGYGQDLLEQYRASGGYGAPQQQNPYGGGGAPPRAERPRSPGMGLPFAPPGGLESMLPTDPASLKRIADQIKNMVGDAPFKLRDQVMKDLQHVPGDLATVLTALNELLANIAGNPMAERFVMNAIKTAVVNDGVIGSLGKIIKMTGFGGGGGKKSSRSSSAEPPRDARPSSKSRSTPFQDESDDDSSTIRRRKISVRDDEDHASADLFAGSDEPITSREDRGPSIRKPVSHDQDDDSAAGGGRRKKLSIRMEDDNEIARKLMSYDEADRDVPPPPSASTPVSAPVREPVPEESGVRKRKLAIKAEAGSGAEAEIARKLMSYDESTRGSVGASSFSLGHSLKESDDLAISELELDSWFETEIEPEPEPEPEPEQERPARKKVQIIAEPEAEAPVKKRIQIVPEPEVRIAPAVEPEAEAPVKKRIQIVPEPEVRIAPAVEPEAEAPVKKRIQIVPEPEARIEPAVEPDAEEPVMERVQIMLERDVESEPEEEPEAEDPVVDVMHVIESEAAEQSVLVFVPESESVTPSEAEGMVIPEHVVFAALGEKMSERRPKETGEYMTIESDDPVEEVRVAKKPEKQRPVSGKSGRSKRHGRKN
jgi:hypothetical protein